MGLKLRVGYNLQGDDRQESAQRHRSSRQSDALDARTLDKSLKTMRGERRRLHVQEGECEGDANRRIHIRAILQESAIEHEWMAESGVLRPEEACGDDSGDAYLTAATHDICHNMASRAH